MRNKRIDLPASRPYNRDTLPWRHSMLEYLALLLKLFLVFSKVGLLALGSALPGPIATKMSIYVGYEQAGILGAIAAVSGTIAPSGVLMLILAVFFLGQKTPLIDAALTAVRPAVIGLLIWTAYDLGEAVLRRGGITWGQALTTNWDKFLIAAAVALVMIRFGDRTEMAVLVIVGSAILGILVYR